MRRPTYIYIPVLRVNSLGISFQVYKTWMSQDSRIGWPVFVLTLWWKKLRLRRYR